MSREHIRCCICRHRIHPLRQDYVIVKRGNEKAWFCGNCWEVLESIKNSLEAQGFELDKLIREYAGLKQVVEDLLVKLNQRQ